jgi:hypothetical protein
VDWAALPLAGAAVAGAVVGHGLAYALAVPNRPPPGRARRQRPRLLVGGDRRRHRARPGVARATLARSFHAGLRPGAGRPPSRSGRLAGRLALLQVTIYLVQELIERAAAGVPLGGP